MKILPFALLIISLYLLIGNVSAQDVKYNFNCTFYPEIKLISYAMGLYGSEEFDQRLVENTKGFIYFEIETLGNWTNLKDSVNWVVTISCDGEEIAELGGSADVLGNSYLNGSIITEFSWNNTFLVPEKKFCYATSRILGVNRTWDQTIDCSYCACFINDLSSYTYALSDRARVMSLQEFLLQRQLEEQQGQSILNLQMMNLSVALYFFAFITLLVSKDLRDVIEKNKELFGMLVFFTTGALILIFPIDNLNMASRALSYFGGSALIVISFFVLFPKLFIKESKNAPFYMLLMLFILFLFYGVLAYLITFLIGGLIGNISSLNANYAISGILLVSSSIAIIDIWFLIKKYIGFIQRKYPKTSKKIEKFISKNFV